MDPQAPLVAPTHHVWVSTGLAAAVRDDQPGTVIRLARQAAGLTLDQLGRLYGCSASTMSRIERGGPPGDQVDVRRALADLLGIPHEYVGLARHAPPGDRQPGPAAATLRAGGGDRMRRRTLFGGAGAAALTTVIGTPPAVAGGPVDMGAHLERLMLAPARASVPFTLAQATADVTAAAAAYRSARYGVVAAALPDLLAGLHATAAHSTGRPRDTAAGLLARAYQLASNVATKHGDDAIALTMADRARTEAAMSGDPLMLTAATHILAITMRRDGHHTAALELLTATAQHLDIAGLDPAVVAAYGNLLCTAAYTSAQAGDPGSADTYLREATAAAGHIDGHHIPASALPFSPTTVAMYQISVHTTLGNTGTALKHALGVNPALLPTPERHGRYLVDTARAWARHGRADKAAHAVLAAHRHAPEEVNRASVRDLVTTLLYAPTPTPAALRDLATRIGVG
ncbi:helix-turn-helix domain-containing protein, partial [Actinoplanes siamensis]|uniref:helix-turn-helix domain-containing protein n=1 Tax=Actinoplanes siamensis TaxID=1223317 RepID=UPI001941D3E3